MKYGSGCYASFLCLTVNHYAATRYVLCRSLVPEGGWVMLCFPWGQAGPLVMVSISVIFVCFATQMPTFASALVGGQVKLQSQERASVEMLPCTRVVTDGGGQWPPLKSWFPTHWSPLDQTVWQMIKFLPSLWLCHQNVSIESTSLLMFIVRMLQKHKLGYSQSSKCCLKIWCGCSF